MFFEIIFVFIFSYLFFFVIMTSITHLESIFSKMWYVIF